MCTRLRCEEHEAILAMTLLTTMAARLRAEEHEALQRVECDGHRLPACGHLDRVRVRVRVSIGS